MRGLKFSQELTKFIERAAEIGRLCSDESVKRSRNEFLAVDIHDKYIIWKIEFYNFLFSQKLYEDASLFRIENTVPYLKSGVEYGGKDSVESRGLIKAISLELDEKLKHIRELYQQNKQIVNTRKNKVVSSTNVIFYFNQSNGELSLYPKEKNKICTFVVGKRRYKIIGVLIQEKENGNHYVLTGDLAEEAGYKSSQKCREGVHAIRAIVEKTFKKIKGDEFIEGKQTEGYRIGEKFDVSFEDTQ